MFASSFITSNNYYALMRMMNPVYRLIDDTARDFLNISFAPKRVLHLNPATHWMMEWDVATFVEALDEAYPLALGERHLGRGQRWLEVAYRVQSTVQVRNDEMAALRNFLIAEVNNAAGDT